MNDNEIQIGKMYDQYSKEELALLPQLPANVTGTGQKVPYMWDGHQWQWVMID